MASNTQSLSQLIQIVREVSLKHLMVKSFKFGPLWEGNATRSLQTPYIWLEESNSTITMGNNSLKTSIVGFNMYCMDRINRGDSNYDEILSDTKFIIDTIITELDQHPLFIALGLGIYGDVSIQPVLEETDVNCNGHMCTFAFRLPMRYTPCNVPIGSLAGFTYSLNNNVFNYSLTMVPGATGATGPQGPIGPTGSDGATGSQGPQGFQGPTGSDGPQGITGSVGPQGFQGSTGSQGPQGFQGVTGSQGPQGVSGPIGATGSQGSQGPTGPGITSLIGDVVASGSGLILSATISDHVVTNIKIRESVGVSVIGRSVNSTGDVADITAVNALSALRLDPSGTSIGFSLNPLSIMFAGAIGSVAGNTSSYFLVQGGSTGVGRVSELARATPVPAPCTALRLFVRTNTAQPGTGSLIFTFRVNNTSTPIALTIAAGSAAGVYSIVTGTASLAPGDLMTYEATNNASTTSATLLTAAICLY